MAYVTTLSRDYRVGVRDEGNSKPVHQFEEVEAALYALDGKTRTQVVLEGPDQALIIGGGNNGLYNALIAVETDQAFYNLVRFTNESKLLHKLVIGGQEGIFQDGQCVDLKTILKAAQVFFSTGDRASELVWD